MSITNFAKISAIIFDFDGVLTDNRVYVDQDGRETVCCNRSDGLAFDALRNSGVSLFILSTETNPVVSARGRKIRVQVHQGSGDKLSSLVQLASEQDIQLKSILYVGNDLNDYHAMRRCGFRVCPNDSHPRIKAIADVVLESSGGQGVVREIVEDVLGLDMLALLNPSGTSDGHP